MLIGTVDNPNASRRSPPSLMGVLGKAATLALIGVLAVSPSTAAASSVLSRGALEASSDVIVVGKGDFSDRNAPMTGVIRPRHVLKGVRQVEYEIQIKNDYRSDTDVPQWFPVEEYIKAKFFLVRQSDGSYFVLGTEGVK